jgi:hypothetical protein
MKNDRWRRDIPQFFNLYETSWESMDGPAPIHGLEGRIISKDPDNGQVTLMARVPAGWSHTETGDDGSLEIFVLEGDMTGNGKQVGAGGFLAVPRKCGPLELFSAGGAYVHIWYDPLFTLDYYYDNQPYVTKIWQEPWVLTDMPEVRHGIMHKSLRWPDPCEGLIHGGPGGILRFILMTPGFPEARQETHHDCWEEIVWLTGDFMMPRRGIHGPGSFLGNPAELKHGGLMTQAGTLMILHCDAPMGAEFTEIPNGQQIVENYLDTTSWLNPPGHTPWEDCAQYDLHPTTEPVYNPAKPA